MEEIVLALFVDGQNPQSTQAIEALQQCTSRLRVPCRVEIVDVLKDPGTAKRHAVFVTPSVLRLQPPPAKRAVGGFDDLEHVLTALELTSYLQVGRDGS